MKATLTAMCLRLILCATSGVNNRNCLGCETKPPLISPSIVRELGTSFCKLKSLELSDEQLMDKLAKKRAVGRPRKNKDAASSMNNNDATSATGPGKTPENGRVRIQKAHSSSLSMTQLNNVSLSFSLSCLWSCYPFVKNLRHEY